MDSSEIYRNSKAAREALIDLRSLFGELGFQITSESFYAHEAYFVARKEEVTVSADWYWEPGLVIRLQGEASGPVRSAILEAIVRRGVREDRVI